MRFDKAVSMYLEFAGQEVKLGDSTDPQLSRFKAWLEKSGSTWRRRLEGPIRQIALAWNPAACSPPYPLVGELPPANAGTLRHYFHTVYVPAAMSGAEPKSIASTLGTIRALYHFVGRDLELGEQSDEIASNFFRMLLKSETTRATVNRRRAEWFAVWNHAYNMGLVKSAPRVKKLKENRDPADAWSIDETKAILEAASTCRVGQCYGRIPCPLWWRALLLVGYYTGLRRRSLLQLKWADFDPRAGVLIARGSDSKTRVGKKFRLGADAIDALKVILAPNRDLLFETNLGWTTIGRDFKQIIERAGVAPSRRKTLTQFHKLRRTTYTAVAAKAGISAAADLCGHSTRYLSDRYLDPEKLGACEVGLKLPQISAAVG